MNVQSNHYGYHSDLKKTLTFSIYFFESFEISIYEYFFIQNVIVFSLLSLLLITS